MRRIALPLALCLLLASFSKAADATKVAEQAAEVTVKVYLHGVLAGTGVVVKHKDEFYILTCGHVVTAADETEGAENRKLRIRYERPDGSTGFSDAKVVKLTDVKKGEVDLALIEIDNKQLKLTKAAVIAPVAPRIGSAVYGYGVAVGSLCFTAGLVSRHNDLDGGQLYTRLQPGMIDKGCSGCGIWDVEGKLVGVGQSALMGRFGWAIPQDTVLKWLAY